MVSSTFLGGDDMIDFQVAELEMCGTTSTVTFLLTIEQLSIFQTIVTRELAQVRAGGNVSAD